MRWIANLTVVVALVFLFGCSSIDVPQANTETAYVTLVGQRRDDPFLRYLRLQGVPGELDGAGRTRLVNDQATLTALNRWLMLQRTILETVAKNMANNNSLYDAHGNFAPYRRRIVGLDDQNVARVIADQRPLKNVYEPDHPDADDNGYIKYPNIDSEIEMKIALDVSRQYEMTDKIIRRLDPTVVRVTWFEHGDYFDLMDWLIKTKMAVNPTRRGQLLANHPFELDRENEANSVASVVLFHGGENHEKFSADIDRQANEIERLAVEIANSTNHDAEAGEDAQTPKYVGLGTRIANSRPSKIEFEDLEYIPKPRNMFKNLDISTPPVLDRFHKQNSQTEDRDVLLAKQRLDIHDEVDQTRLHLAKVRYQPIGLIDLRKAYRNIDQVLMAVKKVIDVSVKNLSNVNTNGYKRLSPSVKADSADVQVVLDAAQGDLIRTD